MQELEYWGMNDDLVKLKNVIRAEEMEKLNESI